jgi:hypothetical protein
MQALKESVARLDDEEHDRERWLRNIEENGWKSW